MKVKVFWLILLKTVGILFILRGSSLINTTFKGITIVCVKRHTLASAIQMSSFCVFTLFVFIFYLLIVWLFIFKTAWLMRILRLEQGLEDAQIDISNNNIKGIARVSIIVTGTMMVIYSLPHLCRHLIILFYSHNGSYDIQRVILIFLYAVGTIVGCLLMTNSIKLTAFVCKRAAIGEEDDSNQQENDT